MRKKVFMFIKWDDDGAFLFPSPASFRFFVSVEDSRQWSWVWSAREGNKICLFSHSSTEFFGTHRKVLLAMNFFFAPFSRCSLHQRKTNKTRHLLRCATNFAALYSSNNSNNIKNDDTAVTMIIMMVSRPESAANNQVEKQYEEQQKFWP